MLTLGTIGTSWITSSFIDGALATGGYKLDTVYSRNAESAQTIAQKHNAKVVTSLPLDVDVVYIASPNSLHYEHAKACLLHGSHVIIEKPATSTPAELDDLYRIAKDKNVFLLEGFRHLHEANFHRVDLDRLGRIFGASLTYASYSSRYDNVLAGQIPNIFNLQFSGGSLVDIGCYCIAFAVALFGKPKSQSYSPYMCPTGVDAGGPVILQYEEFSVQINQSKCFTSIAPTEIYGEKGTLILNATTDIDSIQFQTRVEKKSIELAMPKAKLNLQEEAAEFARIIIEKDYNAAAKLERISRDVLDITADLRKQNGIVFGVEQR